MMCADKPLNITINSNGIENVTDIKYLDSIIDNNEDQSKEVSNAET